MGARGPQSIGGTPVSLHLYVEDADAWFRRAIDAGATVSMPLEDTFWGDRYGQVTDPFGHQWALATHKEDMSEEELRRRAETMAAQSS
jgi:PhnB protein